MESNGCMGLMAVVAASSGVVLVAFQLHKRLASDFMKKMESELGGVKIRPKKRVTFAADVIDPVTDNKAYRRRRLTALSK